MARARSGSGQRQRPAQRRRPATRCDVLIVGGGPAGLSAALVLARARRRVVVCDDGRPRNGRARAIHGFLSRDGVRPGALRRRARAQARAYGVRLRDVEVRGARRSGTGFVARLARGAPIAARRLLIATGVTDRVPELPGIASLYGRSVHHCPFCDGWEWRDRALAVYGRGRAAAGAALGLLAWSRDVALLSHGPSRLGAADRAELKRHEVPVVTRRIARLEGRGGRLRRVVFADGSTLAREALFFSTGSGPGCRLAHSMGCRIDARGAVACDRRQRTTVPGVFVAGDASRDVQFVVVAAAEGARAAVAIHKDLAREDRDATAGGRRGRRATAAARRPARRRRPAGGRARGRA